MCFTNTSWWSWDFFKFIAPKMLLAHLLIFGYFTYEEYIDEDLRKARYPAIELRSYIAAEDSEVG